VLPLVFPTICTQFLLGLTGLFTASGNILYLTAGQGKTTTISFLIFDNVYKRADGSGYYNYASCVGLCFTIVTLPLVAISRYFLNKVEDVQY
jgi:ABC-type sugar transport system permease subunit